MAVVGWPAVEYWSGELLTEVFRVKMLAAALATVSWRTESGSWERTTSESPTALVSELAARFDGEVPGLTVTRPTLEDIYLSLIGAAA